MASGAPIVFLDIDGVLVPWDDVQLDNGRVQLLDGLVTRTGARVVVSSSWRESMSREAIEDQLVAAGFSGRLHSMTPIIVGASRGDEIAAWLEEHAEPDTRFVILDDSSDVEPFRGRLVQTDEYEGLTPDLVERAVELLGGTDT